MLLSSFISSPFLDAIHKENGLVSQWWVKYQSIGGSVYCEWECVLLFNTKQSVVHVTSTRSTSSRVQATVTSLVPEWVSLVRNQAHSMCRKEPWYKTMSGLGLGTRLLFLHLHCCCLVTHAGASLCCVCETPLWGGHTASPDGRVPLLC